MLPTTQKSGVPIMGRPRKKANRTDTPFYEGKLYSLLSQAFPDFVERGRLNTDKLRLIIMNGDKPFARWSLYKWLSADRLTPRAAEAVIAAAKGKLKSEDLYPFVLP